MEKVVPQRAENTALLVIIGQKVGTTRCWAVTLPLGTGYMVPCPTALQCPAHPSVDRYLHLDASRPNEEQRISVPDVDLQRLSSQVVGEPALFTWLQEPGIHHVPQLEAGRA